MVSMNDLAEELKLTKPALAYRATVLEVKVINGEVSEDDASKIRGFWHREKEHKRCAFPSYMRDYIDEVHEEMQNQEMSAAELAALCDLSQTYMSYILRKKSIPSFVIIEKIASALGMKPVLCLVESESE